MNRDNPPREYSRSQKALLRTARGDRNRVLQALRRLPEQPPRIPKLASYPYSGLGKDPARYIVQSLTRAILDSGLLRGPWQLADGWFHTQNNLHSWLETYDERLHLILDILPLDTPGGPRLHIGGAGSLGGWDSLFHSYAYEKPEHEVYDYEANRLTRLVREVMNLPPPPPQT